MAVSYVGASAVVTGANPTVAIPAGYQQNDQLILIVTSSGAAPTATGFNITALGTGGASARIYVLLRFATGSEASVAVTSAATDTTAFMVAYRGTSGVGQASTAATATSTTIATNTFTSSYANQYIVSLYAMASGAATWTAPASTTSRVNSSGTASTTGALIVDELKATTGVTTARTATSSVSKVLSAVSFSLIPSGRYWVGGTGTWNYPSTTNWSFTSGGASGAPTPLAQDDVFFDQAGTYTVNFGAAGSTCNSLTVSAGTVTFSSGTSLAVSGSLSLVAGTNWSFGATVTFNSTTTGNTITTNGTSFNNSAIVFDGVGGDWTLGSAFTSTAGITVTNGSFNTGNYNVTASSFGSNNSNTRTITFGSSTVSLSTSNGTVFTFGSTNLTFNAGTSQINFTGNIATSQQCSVGLSSSLTYNNLAFTGTLSGTGNIQITGAATVNNLSFSGRTTTGIGNIYISGDLTVAGTLTLSPGSTAVCRTLFTSNNTTTRTLTVGSFAAGSADYDFRDIVIAGAAAPISGTRFGDCKGNSGITFPAAKTVYWNLAGAQSWSSTGWATSSGGSPAVTNFPLAQDTAVFDDTGSVTGTITVNAAWSVGTIDMSARTSAMTLSNNTAYSIFGNWINGSGTTISGTSTITFAGRTTQTLTSAGKSFPIPVAVNSPGGTLQFQDNFTSTIGFGNPSISVSSSSINLNNNSLNLSQGFSFSGSGTLAFGTGNITLTGSGTVFTGSSTATVTGTPNVYVSYTGATGVNITPNSPSEANAINFIITSGTFALTTSNASYVKNLDFSNGGTSTFTGSWQFGANSFFCYGNLTLKSGMTVDSGIGTITFAATSGTKTITTNGVTIDHAMTFGGNGSTVQLQDALTLGSTRTATLSATGSLDLNGKTFTAGLFTCSGGTLAFGTGNITLVGSGTVWSGSLSTTVTGTPTVYVSNNTATATTLNPLAVSEANSINFIITVGTYSLSIGTGHAVENLDFSNGGTSTYTGAWAGTTNTLTCYGNLILKSGMTVTGTGRITFAATSGTKTITSAGLTNTHPITFNGVGGTWQLQDALNISSATTGAITLTNGTFDLNGFSATLSAAATATFLTGVGTKNLTFNSGTLTIAASGTTAFNNAQPTGFTTTAGTGTGTISFTSASAKSIVGGSSTYNCVLNQGGAGALTITGSNIFSDITNTYSATGATSILLSSGQTVAAFTASGAAAKLLTLNSSTAGVQTTLALSSGGTVSTDYLSVKDIAFTPAPATDGTTPYVWYLGANSTNSGNNTGGLFQAGGTGALKVYQIANTATTSWTVPSDWNSSSNTIHLIGAGGGGGGSRATSTTNKAGGAGGGGGGYRVVTNYSTTPSSSITVAVGAGGTAGAVAGGTGGTGGTTSWAGTNTATGGTGGSTTTTPTSVGGTGGTGTFSGGTGGAGSTTTTLSVIVTGGGGGGAAGPNGAGGTGGIGFGNATAANTAGGGGGGNGGGSAGGNASSATGGTGGNNFGGTGGGASNTAGTVGGGGGGGVNSAGKSGGTGIDILNTIGGGGGSGGSAGVALAGVSGVVYGAGGSGGSTGSSTTTNTGGAGAQGLIVIAYVPAAGAYTITANNGSYTVTGQTATIQRSRLLTANNGTYAVTGQTATIQKTRILAGDYGIYALTGQTASIVKTSPGNYVLIANNGAYTVAGQPATLLRSKLIFGDYGSYTTAGQDATITYGGNVVVGDEQLLIKLRSFTERRRF